MESLKDKFLARQQEKENVQKEKLLNKPYILAQRLRKAFEKESFKQEVEKNLIEYGSVTIKRSPCTCTSGNCEDTKGFEKYIEDIIQEWDDKGVLIDFCINQTFYLKGTSINRAFEKSRIFL